MPPQPSLVEHYVAVAPPEYRVVTSAIDARLRHSARSEPPTRDHSEADVSGHVTRFVVDVDSYETALIEESVLEAGSRVAISADGIGDSPYVKSLLDLAGSGRALESLDARAITGSPGIDEPFALTV